jgi:zinc transport system ATP-binding protein
MSVKETRLLLLRKDLNIFLKSSLVMDNPDDYVLRVSNLSVTIQDQIILDDISFRVKKGTTLAIMGPNGAGKTVLFRALLNLVPYSGKIQWRDKIKTGYVPQNLSAGDIPISVKEFLSFKDASNIENSLGAVGLDSRNILNKRLGALSGGQLRRVLIAWAIIDKPDVLLFDEPTSGVDLDSEESIYKMLRDLSKKNGITVMIISHNVHIVIEYSDYMLALNKCMNFFGESKELKNPSLQTIIYGEPVCRHEPSPTVD